MTQFEPSDKKQDHQFEADWSFTPDDNGVYEIFFTAADEDGGSVTGSQIVNVGNVAPRVEAATFDVEEHAGGSTVVGSVTATDPGTDTLTYRILPIGDSAGLEVDSVMGVISVADSALLDFELTPSVTLQVEVSDEDGDTSVAQVTVNLLNRPSISGTVFVDANENGRFDANELGIDGVTVELLDATDQVFASTVTSQGGYYLFDDLDPGTYRIREIQPSGVTDGAESLGSAGGTVVANDLMEVTLQRTDGTDYDFAELGQQIGSGDTAGIGFWQNKHGQALIAEGGSNLAQWLTQSFPNIFGSEFVIGETTFASGLTVAEFYWDQLFRQKATQSLGGPAKVDAQFMAVAFATFFTSRHLSRDVGTSYGFNVTDTGIGTHLVNVGSSGAAFGVDDDEQLTILQLLLATNGLTGSRGGRYSHVYDTNGDGKIDANEASLRKKANFIFDSITRTQPKTRPKAPSLR